jgi:hypothetical protein
MGTFFATSTLTYPADPVRHVGVPVLSGVRDTDMAPVLDDVGKDGDFGHPRLPRSLFPEDIACNPPKRAENACSAAASIGWFGKHRTPYCASARNTLAKSASERECARSTPVTLAPSVALPGSILIMRLY